MKRPSFQFYPADWRGNAKLRRCSEAARGAWIDLLCLFHDADEYGVLRWPIAEVARAAGVSLKSALELVRKDVLKGNDASISDFTFTPRHAGQNGETVVLIKACKGPCWFSSRMVTDEWVRIRRGANTRFEATPKVTPKVTPKPPIGSGFGDGPTSSSSSSSAKEEKQGLIEFSTKLKTQRVLNKWGVWMNVRRGMKKPKDWAILFNEQIQWLEQFDEPTAFEILSASIRNGWQGLFEPKNNYGNGKINSTNSRPNPRNVGIIRGPTDYATAKPRRQVELEAERARLAGQMAADENNPSSTQSSAGVTV